jgi:ligand-binding sensor domain-containing protein
VRVVLPVLTGLMLILAPGALQPAHAEWVSHLYMNDVRDLTVTDEGVWCATSGGALFYDFAQSQFRAWNRAADGLASDTLTAVAALDDGRIAFGTARKGVSLLDPQQGLWYSQTSLTWPIASDRVLFIREAPPWRLIGSDGGFVAWRDGVVREACQAGLDICGLPGWGVTAGIDFDGALWFGALEGEGSLGGVGRLNYSTTGTWDTLSVGLTSLQVVALEAWSDSLYCATSRGVAVWRGAAWAARNAGLPAGTVTDLCAGAQRLLVAISGANGGVFEWRESARTWTRVGPAEPILQAYCVAEAADGVVWAGTSALKSGRPWLETTEDGLWEFVGGEWIQHRRDGPHAVGVYRALTVDERGRLWAATSASLRGWRIERLENGSWSFFDQRNTELSNSWVFELRVIDDELWVGHCCCSPTAAPCYLNVWDIGGGAIAVHDSIVNIYDSTEDDFGNLWLASWVEQNSPTAMGIYHLDRASGTWTNYTVESTGGLLTSDKITAVAAEKNHLWIGTQNDGLIRVRLQADGTPDMSSVGWIHYSADATDSPLPSNGIRAIAARAGEVWIGTIDGVALWEEGERWSTLSASPWALPGSEVTDLALTADGAAWVAIRGAGVTRVTRDAGLEFGFERFSAPELVNPDATVLATSPGGRDLWVGTEQGLSHYIPSAAPGSVVGDAVRVFPNPLRPACGTPLQFLALPGRATRGSVTDVNGRVMARFRDKWEGDAFWDGRDLDGRPVAPGLYVIRVLTPRGWLTGRVALLDLPCDE